MSEAEYPRNSAFSQQTNCVNSTQVEWASKRFSDSLDRQTTQAETASYTLVNLLESQAEIESVKFDTCLQWEVAQNSLIAKDNTGTPLFALSELAKLLTLIQGMRASNGNLNQQVIQLDQTLSECQDALQLEKVRSLNAESMLAQKTQELSAAEEQVKDLSQELAVARENAQRQQMQNDTLIAQFQRSQEIIAQMERECAITQTNYNEQSHQLRQTEDACIELRTRLARQQRQTIQLKVALEKCIEGPSRYQPEYFQPDFSPQSSDSVLSSDLLLPKAQPISPWSAQPQLAEEQLEASWTAKFSASPFTPQSSSFDWKGEDLNTYPETEFAQIKAEAIATAKTPVTETFSQKAPEADDLRDTPSPRTIELPKIATDSVDIYSSAESPTETEDAEWQDFVNQLLETFEEPITNHAANNISQQVTPYTNQFQFPQSPQQGINSATTNSNSPSPVIYPSQPPNKRKTLAAIELPKFSKNTAIKAIS